MARTLTPERQMLKEWAIMLASVGMTQEATGKWLGERQDTISRWLKGQEITHTQPFIMHSCGKLMHNSGLIMDNFHDGLPPNPLPQLFVGKAESMDFLGDETVDIIITSPPYNLGQEKWPMGGNGRMPRETGVGYSGYGDDMPEDEYQAWQIKCLAELYRVARKGGSLFYNHKVRQREGQIIHPVTWLQNTTKWLLRQEIIWDRLSTHNHSSTLFWPQDERIYWLTKGKPNILGKIGIPSVWSQFGPIPKNDDHPAPFTPELPKMILKAIGKPGDIVLDPFGGGMTTCLVASAMGYKNIGVDISEAYVKRSAEYFGVSFSYG